MRLVGVASLLAVAGALAAPAPALAVDHVSLSVGPIALEGKPGWRLTAGAPSMGRSDEEILGVTLRRTFRNRTAEEAHALRHSLPGQLRTITFNGERGAWRTRGLLGDVLAINMTVVPSGPAREVETDFRWCRGDFVEVPVRLRGAFVLRTRTRFFGTIRRAQLRGLIRYNRSGTIDCTSNVPPPATCGGWTSLTASEPRAAGSLISVHSELGTTSLHFASREPVGRMGPVWYHWMTVSGVDPLTGALPTLDVRAPSSSPITGSGTFTAGAASESTIGACRVTSVEGTFVGRFQTRFVGWGLRTLEIDTRSASYRVAR